MTGLPTKQRDALDTQMRLLIERAGWERFVTAPFIEPSGESFPDPWTPDAHGVGTVARRLLAHAGLGSSKLRVNDYTAMAETRSVNAADAHFAGVTADKTVELDLHSMGDEVDLVGVLCHEVAAAWLALERIGHGPDDPFRGEAEIEGSNDEMAQARASVASVYLGFGIPATNAAHSARHGGYFDGYYGGSETAITMAGGLSPEAMVYLLSVQLTVRARAAETKLALSHLQANQRAETESWLEALGPDTGAVVETLGLPARNSWPEPRTIDPQPLSSGGVEVSVAVDADELRQFNRGRRVFRVRHRRTGSRTVLGAAAGLAAGLVGIAAGLPDLSAVGIGGAVAVAGLIHGTRSYYWRCSDGHCAQRVTPGDEQCSYCGGTIAGELLSANDRLEAEERLEEDGERPASG